MATRETQTEKVGRLEQENKIFSQRIEELERLQNMIYRFGIRYDTDGVMGHPDFPWQIKLQVGELKSTVYGRTPKEACDKALVWLEKKGE